MIWYYCYFFQQFIINNACSYSINWKGCSYNSRNSCFQNFCFDT